MFIYSTNNETFGSSRSHVLEEYFIETLAVGMDRPTICILSRSGVPMAFYLPLINNNRCFKIICDTHIHSHIDDSTVQPL